MSEPKKHHFVPQGYIRLFCNKNGKVYSFRPKKKEKYEKIKESSPRSICYKKNQYTINDIETLKRRGHSDPYILEKKGFPYEQNFIKEISNKIDKQEPLSSPEIVSFIQFIRSMTSRNDRLKQLIHDPSVIDPIIEDYKRKVKEIGYNKAEQMNESPEIIDDVFENFFEKAFEIVTSQEGLDMTYNLGLLDRSISFGNITQLDAYLLSFKFYVLRTSDIEFISSDNPGFTRHNGGHIADMFLGTAIELYFPITPLSCILIDLRELDKHIPSDKAMEYRSIGNPYVRKINIASVNNCNEIAYGRSYSEVQDLFKRTRKA